MAEISLKQDESRNRLLLSDGESLEVKLMKEQRQEQNTFRIERVELV